MNKKYIIGIDIGGTNTDAVLVNEKKEIEKAYKTPTTQDIITGFKNALTEIVSTNIKHEISGIFIGTTHATNALLQQKDLYKVGIIRIAGNDPGLPPCFEWPKEIRDVIFAGCETIDGGFECDGKSITKFNKEQVKSAAKKLIKQGAESIAIIGIFSPLKADQELEAQNIILNNINKNIPISISSTIGGIGFIERENSTILNCALKKSLSVGFKMLEQTIKELKINAPLYITQNNGTLIDLNKALEFPVLTISAGPTNSFIGATKLANLKNAVVVDIGGTSTDIGIVENGFARRSINSSCIAGITLNFAMPDVLSIGLGGGSYIKKENNGIFAIGPESSGKNLFIDSCSFGGNKTTLTDIALKNKIISIDKAKPENIELSSSEINQIYQIIKIKLEALIEQIKGPKKEIAALLVGGGAQLLPKDILKNCKTIKYSEVANAYGAALSQISGSIDTVVSLNQRETILEQLKEMAKLNAITNGANKEKIEIANIQIIPYNYVPNNMARVIITAAGPKN